MATLRNQQKLAGVSKDTQENTRNSHAENTFIQGMTEEYITQVSEHNEESVTKKLFQKRSRTESRVLGALSKLDDDFWNGKFGLTP